MELGMLALGSLAAPSTSLALQRPRGDVLRDDLVRPDARLSRPPSLTTLEAATRPRAGGSGWVA